MRDVIFFKSNIDFNIGRKNIKATKKKKPFMNSAMDGKYTEYRNQEVCGGFN